jgi:hypothetical protein
LKLPYIILLEGLLVNRRIFMVVAFAAMAGCATPHSGPPPLSDSDPAIQALNESALRVARAAEQAALAQSVNNKTNRVTEEYRIDLTRLPPELQKPLLLENGFNGELETFLGSLTDAIGWRRPIVFGSKPTTPLLVTMTEQRRPPVYWIADAGYQAGAMADVNVDPVRKQIVLTYKEAGGVR